jgi:hypothetical protein
MVYVQVHMYTVLRYIHCYTACFMCNNRESGTGWQHLEPYVLSDNCQVWVCLCAC